MYAIEFQAVIQNGMIPIPTWYQATLPPQVRVIVLADAPESFQAHEDIAILNHM